MCWKTCSATRRRSSGVEIFKREGRGILVYLQEGTAGVPAGAMGGEKTASAATRAQTWRDVGLGAQILRDLNVSSIRLISSEQPALCRAFRASASRSPRHNPGRWLSDFR